MDGSLELSEFMLLMQVGTRTGWLGLTFHAHHTSHLACLMAARAEFISYQIELHTHGHSEPRLCLVTRSIVSCFVGDETSAGLWRGAERGGN